VTDQRSQAGARTPLPETSPITIPQELAERRKTS
jgi:hypothetical protein